MIELWKEGIANLENAQKIHAELSKNLPAIAMRIASQVYQEAETIFNDIDALGLRHPMDDVIEYCFGYINCSQAFVDPDLTYVIFEKPDEYDTVMMEMFSMDITEEWFSNDGIECIVQKEVERARSIYNEQINRLKENPADALALKVQNAENELHNSIHEYLLAEERNGYTLAFTGASCDLNEIERANKVFKHGERYAVESGTITPYRTWIVIKGINGTWSNSLFDNGDMKIKHWPMINTK